MHEIQKYQCNLENEFGIREDHRGHLGIAVHVQLPKRSRSPFTVPIGASVKPPSTAPPMMLNPMIWWAKYGCTSKHRPILVSAPLATRHAVCARNLDVIPGIAYYAKAAEILGDQGDGNDLVHVQMFLLAGLYKGQLTRVKESFSRINMAGRAIIILLGRYKLYNKSY